MLTAGLWLWLAFLILPCLLQLVLVFIFCPNTLLPDSSSWVTGILWPVHQDNFSKGRKGKSCATFLFFLISPSGEMNLWKEREGPTRKASIDYCASEKREDYTDSWPGLSSCSRGCHHKGPTALSLGLLPTSPMLLMVVDGVEGIYLGALGPWWILFHNRTLHQPRPEMPGQINSFFTFFQWGGRQWSIAILGWLITSNFK